MAAKLTPRRVTWGGQPPIGSSPRPDERWLARGLVYADLLTDLRNTVTDRTDNITGTTVAPAPWGLARGFGSTLGVGSADRIQTNLFSSATYRTTIIRYMRAGAGGGGAPRIFDNLAEQINFNEASSLLSYSRDFSTTDGAWSTPAAGLGTALDTKFVLAIAYDASSRFNNPAIYLNGSPVAVTTNTTPVGVVLAGSTAYSLGNRAAGDRAWNGLISDFYVFDSILTDREIAELADPSRVWADRTIWVPVSIASVTLCRPTSDILTTGWTASTGSDLYAMVDEAVANDSDYVISPLLSSPTPLTFGITPSAPAGTHTVRVRGQRTDTTGQVRVHLLDASNAVMGSSAWQALTATDTTYTLSITTSGAATRMQIEVAP